MLGMLHLSELLLRVLHTRVDCVFLCICLLVSHRYVSLLVRVLGTGCVGRVGTIKAQTQPFPALKAGHSVSYSYICDVCLEWVNEVGSFCLASVLCTCFSCHSQLTGVGCPRNILSTANV